LSVHLELWWDRGLSVQRDETPQGQQQVNAMALVRATGLGFAAILTGGFVAVASSSGASAQANCEMYGRMALQQMQQNIQQKCNLTGPEWSSDLKAHTTWCGSVGPDQWKVQLQKRDQALATCAAPKK
jgi:hypothetical protein